MTMWKAPAAIALSWTIYLAGASAGEIAFSAKPQVQKAGDKVTINFTVAAPTDVEVAVLNAKGEVVRHLAAGVLGAKNAPPEPLQAALAQKLVWDGQDDFGKAAAGGPFKVRVRAGMDVKFGRLIGADPYNFGAIDSMATDEDGNIFIMGCQEEQNQMNMTLRVFDPNGRYLREIMPFPANLPPDAMKDVARWDAERKTFSPRNLRSLNPDFYGQPGGYWGNPPLRLLSVSSKNGVILTDSAKLCTLETSGAVRGQNLVSRALGGVVNSGAGPTFVTISPDGKWVYLSGPFSSVTSSGHTFDANFPPGRVYRASLAGADKFKEFVTIPVAHTNGQGGAWFKACQNTTNFTLPKGPVHQVAVDGQGNVYVANREQGCVSVFDESGKAIGEIAIKNPHLVAVHPQTGAIYVTQFDCLAYGKFQCVLNKFANYQEGTQPVATCEFPPSPGVNGSQFMTLSVAKDKTVVWMTGVKGGVVPLQDKGAAFEPLPLQFAPKMETPGSWSRIAVDYDRDEVYISNGTNGMWRYSGLTGEGGRLKQNGKDFSVLDLAVGYDGLLYTQLSDGSYSGPFVRLNRDLTPAPFAGSGTHVLAEFIYGRKGLGFCVRGLGVGPEGQCYESFMQDWVKYGIFGFGTDGKPIKGKYQQGGWPAKSLTKCAGLEGSVIGPVPGAVGDIRVDMKGDIYVAMMYKPKDCPPPKGFEKDQAYRVAVGSVVRFGPEGGAMKDEQTSPIATTLEGAKKVYPGLAPFSSHAEAFGGNTCCVCRTPRFDLDRYGRLALPNCMTNSVLVYDNAGNVILEFGKYGNFDSQFVNPLPTDAKQQGLAAISMPDIPLAWPTGAGFGQDHIYVNDTYNRRAVRVDVTFKSEEICEPK